MLSLDEVKKLGLDHCEYKEGVYRYKINGKWTLVENGVVVAKNAYDVHWHKERGYSYKYETDGKYTLVGNKVDSVEDIFLSHIELMKRAGIGGKISF